MRSTLPLVITLFASLTNCARFGNLGDGLGRTLSRDANRMAVRSGPGFPGPHRVQAEGVQPAGAAFPVALYRPTDASTPSPAVIFLPGRFSPEDQYESYARLLASHGFVVVVRGMYGPEYTDRSLVRDTLWLSAWLQRQPYVDGQRIGVAGHSMGGRDAITAAVQDATLRAVVSIDPGGQTSYPVIYGDTPRLAAPLLLIGGDEAWRGEEVCAPKATNYERFFAQSRPGTVQLTLRGADHVQLMDEPDRLGMGMCRVGSANSESVRFVARSATVQFFEEHLRGAAHREFGDGVLAVATVRPTRGHRGGSEALPNGTLANIPPPAPTASATAGTVAERAPARVLDAPIERPTSSTTAVR